MREYAAAELSSETPAGGTFLPAKKVFMKKSFWAGLLGLIPTTWKRFRVFMLLSGRRLNTVAPLTF